MVIPTPGASGGGAISFVQVASATPLRSTYRTVAVTYPLAQTAGNLNVVVVGWNDTTSTVTSVTDSRGNTLHAGDRADDGDGVAAVDLLREEHRWGQQHGDGDVQPGGGYLDVRVLEYSGLDTATPLDVTAGAAGTGVTREQRGGDDDVGERVDFRSGDDGGNVRRIGDGVCDPDHHAGFGHRAGQDGEQHGELQCVGDADLFLALGDADGDVPGGALTLRQRF